MKPRALSRLSTYPARQPDAAQLDQVRQRPKDGVRDVPHESRRRGFDSRVPGMGKASSGRWPCLSINHCLDMNKSIVLS